MDNLSRVESIFVAALEKRSHEARVAYLDEACGADVDVRRGVERLLRAQEKAGHFLRTPLQAATADEPLTERQGAVIGPYKLLQQIGEGGMGVVYMAEQQQPLRRKVALKIIKPGMDSAQVIARFAAERQALALMDHQNIAKVLDAGTVGQAFQPDTPSPSQAGKPDLRAGRPYFVMELVHGVPITQYCDDHHLTPKERLELFLPVCHAVQHAHQKGIIHRDLKPSNVLVCLYDGVAVPKVIDFGIAKATGQQLTERTMFTQFGSLVGTLEYMSPEQAEMSQLGIDTRSDVYSMGVMLYELLTGTTPLERKRVREAGFDEIRRLIREEEPPKPSTRLSASGVALAAISAQRQTEPAKLTRLVRGELDWIVMKALEKDRNRRYESANGLARDVERYLHDEPVEACPPTAGYKLRKFARKHKAGLATAVGFVALLVLGVAVSAWQAVRATQAETVAQANEQQANEQRDEAQQQRDEARALAEKLQAALEQLRRTTYAAHINLAKQAWDEAAVPRVLELLDQQRPKPGEPDLRGFEWNYLRRLCHSDLLTLKGHTGEITSVAYSPDGKRLASGAGNTPGKPGEVKVWDAQTGQELLPLKVHNDIVWSVAFSPDGKRLASACRDQTVKVWDVQSGQELLSLKGHTNSVWSVAFSPDGKRLASGSWDQMVRVWDAQTGRELLSLKGHGAGVESVAFSPDGKRLASASDDQTVKVWDAQTGQELLSLKVTGIGLSTSVAFSPDGKRLASAGKVWDAQTGQELLSLMGHTGNVRGVAFSPDGKRLASSSQGGWTLRIWDLQTGQEIRTIKGGGGSVVFSPDGRRLASGSADHTVKVWDAEKDQENLTLQGDAQVSVAFSPDGRRLASASQTDSTVNVWDAQTGQRTLTLKGPTGRVRSVAFSPDGKRLASSGGGHRSSAGWGWSPGDRAEVKVWDAQTGQELPTLQGHTGIVHSVAFSPDGKRLASGSGRMGSGPGEVKVWDAQTGQELLFLKELTYAVNSVGFSPDGKSLASAHWAGGYSAGKPGEVKVWDAQTGQELLTLQGGGFVGVAFSPDGKRLASGNGTPMQETQPGEVKVWNVQTGQELLTLKGHTSCVYGVAFSPDGKRLASASRDEVKLWDAQTGQELLTLKGRGVSVAFSPDGKRLASAGGSSVTIWDATPLPEKP
jgi:WD40 repeat protein/serine/threonine protein kinase